MRQGNKSNNRTKGHRVERLYAQIFRDLGYVCKTSRATSKELDDAKVDLDGIPFNIQIKAGYTKGLDYSLILSQIREGISKSPFLGHRKDYPFLLIHHKDSKGQKRLEEEQLVVMSFHNFLKLIESGKK